MLIRSSNILAGANNLALEAVGRSVATARPATGTSHISPTVEVSCVKMCYRA